MPDQQTKRDAPYPRVCISVAEFSAATGISKPTLYRHMAEGRIQFIKLGKLRKIPVAEFDRLFNPTA
jgi:excisionase family DNA binding protein